MSKFSVRFKELRKSRKLSQQALADSLNTSKSSVNMYERGEREPGIDTLETIADFFNVDMDYLLGKSDIVNKAIYNEVKIDLSPVKKITDYKTASFIDSSTFLGINNNPNDAINIS